MVAVKLNAFSPKIKKRDLKSKCTISAKQRRKFARVTHNSKGNGGNSLWVSECRAHIKVLCI